MFSLTDEADLALDVSLATKLWSLKEPDANTIGYLLMSSAIIARLCIFYLESSYSTKLHPVPLHMFVHSAAHRYHLSLVLVRALVRPEF